MNGEPVRGRRRPRHAAAVRAAQRPRAAGRPVRLRRRAVRRLLRARRRRRPSRPATPRSGRWPASRSSPSRALRRRRPASRAARRPRQAGGAVRLLRHRHRHDAAPRCSTATRTPARRTVTAALDRNLCRCGVAAADGPRGGRGRRGRWLSRRPASRPAERRRPAEGPRAPTRSCRAGSRSARDGVVDVRVGKVELGQGILTALAQIAADELGRRPRRRSGCCPADTADGPGRGPHRRQHVDRGLRAGAAAGRGQRAGAVRRRGGAPRLASTRPVTSHVADLGRTGATYAELAARVDLTCRDPRCRQAGATGRGHRRAPARPARQGRRAAPVHPGPAPARPALRPRRPAAVARCAADCVDARRCARPT